MKEDLHFNDFFDTKSILVITERGELMRLNCPFTVFYKNLKQFHNIELSFVVDRIVFNMENKIYYVIRNSPKIYSEFLIVEVDNLDIRYV